MSLRLARRRSFLQPRPSQGRIARLGGVACAGEIPFRQKSSGTAEHRASRRNADGYARQEFFHPTNSAQGQTRADCGADRAPAPSIASRPSCADAWPLNFAHSLKPLLLEARHPPLDSTHVLGEQISHFSARMSARYQQYAVQPVVIARLVQALAELPGA